MSSYETEWPKNNPARAGPLGPKENCREAKRFTIMFVTRNLNLGKE